MKMPSIRSITRVGVFAGAALIAGSSCGLKRTVDRTTIVQNGVYQGAFVGHSITEASVSAFEKKTGKPLSVAVKFMQFASGLNFPSGEAEVMSGRKGALFIKLEPWSGKLTGDNPYSLDNILAGKCDYLLQNFAAGARKYNKPVFVAFAHEMNGDWYPWGQQDAQKYIDAYRYVYNKLKNEYKAVNLTFVWNINIADPTAEKDSDKKIFEKYYPGDEYVDWIAVDGYNTTDTSAKWQSFQELFGTTLASLLKYKKPIMIGEFGCDSNSEADETTNKPKWLGDAVNYICGQKLGAYIYFDLDKTESGGDRKWAIVSPSNSATSYIEALKANEKMLQSTVDYQNNGSEELGPELPTN